MGDYGLKVAKAGQDVDSASIINQIFNSSYNKLKIVAQDDITVNVNGTTTHTIAHGLGYAPAFLVYAQLSTSTTSYLVGSFDINSGSGEGFSAKADATNFYIELDGAASPYDAYIYYYIFADVGL